MHSASLTFFRVMFDHYKTTYIPFTTGISFAKKLIASTNRDYTLSSKSLSGANSKKNTLGLVYSILSRCLISLFAFSIICICSLSTNAQCNITPTLTSDTIYDGSGNTSDFFVVCLQGGIPPSYLTVQNGINSSYYSAFNNYTIDWGDNSTAFTSTSDSWSNPTANHGYYPGIYTLTFSASTSSCTVTNTYIVYAGDTLAIEFGTPGTGESCSEVTMNFPISGTENNLPTTIYTVSLLSD